MIKIFIGLGENKEILSAVDEALKIKDLKIEIANSNEELLSAMKDKNVDAVVRGSLKSSIINELKKIDDFRNSDSLNSSDQRNTNLNTNRASYITKENHTFLLAPVGIDEGRTIEEKMNLIIQCCEFIKKIDETPKIAILAGGRKEDFGRNKQIDKSIADSEKLTNELTDYFKKIHLKNHIEYSVKNYHILIEKAIADKNNIIIAPDGITGNLIFRTMVLVNSCHSHGAITLGMNKIFIDTSRDQQKDGYLRALKLAYSLAKNRN